MRGVALVAAALVVLRLTPGLGRLFGDPPLGRTLQVLTFLAIAVAVQLETITAQELAAARTLMAFHGSRYDQAQTALPPGSLLLVFSDGLSEARDAQGQEYGEAGSSISHCETGVLRGGPQKGRFRGNRPVVPGQGPGGRSAPGDHPGPAGLRAGRVIAGLTYCLVDRRPAWRTFRAHPPFRRVLAPELLTEEAGYLCVRDEP